MIRIFIGVSANDEDLEFQSVLHYSLQKHASEELDITWMRVSKDPQSFWHGWNMTGWATPFSALRWGIPAICNFEGKAIYMDVDMIPRADIAELWYQPIPEGFAMLSKPEAICVTMYDNARMKAVLPPIKEIKSVVGSHRKIRQGITQHVARYRGDWNCLDMRRVPGVGEYKDVNDPEIKLIHFTSIPTQPHLRFAIPRLQKEGRRHWYANSTYNHPRRDAMQLFDDIMLEAVEAGYVMDNYRNPEPFGPYGR